LLRIQRPGFSGDCRGRIGLMRKFVAEHILYKNGIHRLYLNQSLLLIYTGSNRPHHQRIVPRPTKHLFFQQRELDLR
jgi:hypothetical protein